jgi:hypothetical protein
MTCRFENLRVPADPEPAGGAPNSSQWNLVTAETRDFCDRGDAMITRLLDRKLVVCSVTPMNAVEIEEAVSRLVVEPFDPTEFPFQFITAFGAKKTTVDRLRKGDSNQSDVGGVHYALAALRSSPKTAAHKAKFILATDGETVEAEDLVGGDVIACAYADLPRNFATFLPLAGISTVKEIKNNPIDVKATGRLNKLYVTLLSDNPDWATEERRPALNQFMARLIFCYFAEDTGIFNGESLFTDTVARMSEAGHGSGETQWGNTHEVLQHLFRAMETPVKHDGNFDNRHRRAAGIRFYADVFPYVNGGLFSAASECPRFSRTARAYLLSAGELDWKEINPDIFGSMIQAVADDGERGELGMHYTSVPNILKVLNPLFLDDLREQLGAAGDSKQKLRNLRKRLAIIRVFDPACGSGNFLVIAYKQMRAIEATIVERLGGEATLKLDDRRSVILLSNFYGIEIKGFAAEIARLALLIAEFQADCIYLSQQEARAMVLPLHKTGQITVGNALRLDWLDVCPPVRVAAGAEHDLGGPTGRLALVENKLIDRNSEIYICGNPPYKGSQDQTPLQKDDLRLAFTGSELSTGTADYVLGWFSKARSFSSLSEALFAFVTTNSVHQGRSVAKFWPYLCGTDLEIFFAEPSFRWSNLASNKAVVTVSIIGVGPKGRRKKLIFDAGLSKEASIIGPYLVPDHATIVEEMRAPLSDVPAMSFGSMPNDGGHLLMSQQDATSASNHLVPTDWVRRIVGTNEVTKGQVRYCLWLEDIGRPAWEANEFVRRRVCKVLRTRIKSSRDTTRKLARTPSLFGEIRQSGRELVIAVGGVSSERREYLPVDLMIQGTIISNLAYGLFDTPAWCLALIASRLHRVWIATACGQLETRYRYSNTLGWNTFPVPKLTGQDKADLTRTAENILLAREAHFPATLGDLYDPEDMPDDLRRAHEENDQVLERAYIGRRFRNDTERLEKLFDLYTTMTADAPKAKKGK